MRSGCPLSIQIVTWNSAAVLGPCLESLSRQTCRTFEVVVVDNASTDGSADVAAAWSQRLPCLRVTVETENRGFCGGQNRAYALSSGALVLFLNPDTILPPTFVERALAVAAAADPRVGSFAACLFLPDGRVDSTGLEMDRFRRAYDRHRGAPAEAAASADRRVFGCTGAAALHRRAMLDDVRLPEGPLDEQLFAYYDDLDLSWRARLRGWRCEYVPDFVAVHQRAGRNAIRRFAGRAGRSRDRALSVRNRLLVMIKCERAGDALLALPWLVPFELARAGYLAVAAPQLLGAYVEVLRGVRTAWRKRRALHAATPAPLAMPALPWRVR